MFSVEASIEATRETHRVEAQRQEGRRSVFCKATEESPPRPHWTPPPTTHLETWDPFLGVPSAPHHELYPSSAGPNPGGPTRGLRHSLSAGVLPSSGGLLAAPESRLCSPFDSDSSDESSGMEWSPCGVLAERTMPRELHSLQLDQTALSKETPGVPSPQRSHVQCPPGVSSSHPPSESPASKRELRSAQVARAAVGPDRELSRKAVSFMPQRTEVEVLSTSRLREKPGLGTSRRLHSKSFGSLQAFRTIHEDLELQLHLPKVPFPVADTLPRGGTSSIHEDLEMRILTERLKLLSSQRELAAIHCSSFARYLEASLLQPPQKSRSATGVPSPTTRSRQFLVDDDEQYWSSPNFYRGKFRGYDRQLPCATPSSQSRPSALSSKLPLDPYFMRHQKQSKAKLPNRHSRHSKRHGSSRAAGDALYAISTCC